MGRIPRAMLTNDDGIDAPGMAAMEAIAAEVADEVWVVAPEEDQSGTSASVSLHRPVRVRPRGERRFAVTGTPTDCVVVGLSHLMADAPPSLILSGVNRGANLADEVAYSGTASAAMAGLLLGVRSIALSQAFRNRDAIPWDSARLWGASVVRHLWEAGAWDADVAYNVNVPDLEPGAVRGVQATRQGRGSVVRLDTEKRTDRRGFDYFWLGFARHASAEGLQPSPHADLGPGTDVGALREGFVSVTPLRFDRTHKDQLAPLGAGLAAVRAG
jgi:5'-nucleotidase